MTAKEALDAATDAEPGERLRRFETICGPRGSCRRELCERDPGRWSFCPDCLTVFDDYGKAVNPIREFGLYIDRTTARIGPLPRTADTERRWPFENRPVVSKPCEISRFDDHERDNLTTKRAVERHELADARKRQRELLRSGQTKGRPLPR